MFLRSTRRFKDGKPHHCWSLVENRRRRGGRVVQHTVLCLGEINNGSPSARKMAEESAAELQRTERAIHVQAKYKYDDLWAPEEFDVRRWLIAQQLLRLQGALAKLADR